MAVIISEILISAVIGIILGSLWYSPLMFGNIWMKLMGISTKQVEKSKKDPKVKKEMMISYGIMFISSLVMFFVLSVAINVSRATTFGQGSIIGFFCWLGFIATTSLGAVLWENKSWKLYFINVGYYLALLLIMGGLIAYL